jgi:hypothetical protein
VKRSAFIAATAAIAGSCGLVRPVNAQDDPAVSSQVQALRVLLGTGRMQTIDAQTFLYEG